MLKNILLIGAGGFIGSISRYLLSRFVEVRIFTSFPLGTFAVNVIGCFIIGILYGLIIKGSTTPEIRFLLVTGFCGGFTTFQPFHWNR